MPSYKVTYLLESEQEVKASSAEAAIAKAHRALDHAHDWMMGRPEIMRRIDKIWGDWRIFVHSHDSYGAEIIEYRENDWTEEVAELGRLKECPPGRNSINVERL